MHQMIDKLGYVNKSRIGFCKAIKKINLIKKIDNSNSGLFYSEFIFYGH